MYTVSGLDAEQTPATVEFKVVAVNFTPNNITTNSRYGVKDRCGGCGTFAPGATCPDLFPPLGDCLDLVSDLALVGVACSKPVDRDPAQKVDVDRALDLGGRRARTGPPDDAAGPRGWKTREGACGSPTCSLVPCDARPTRLWVSRLHRAEHPVTSGPRSPPIMPLMQTLLETCTSRSSPAV